MSCRRKIALSRGIFWGGENWENCEFFFCVGLAVDERSADRFYM